MDGEGGPQSELRLRQVKSVADDRKEKQGNRIQHEDGPE